MECQGKENNHCWEWTEEGLLGIYVMQPASDQTDWVWNGLMQLGPMDNKPTGPIKMSLTKGGVIEYKEDEKAVSMTPYCYYSFQLNDKSLQYLTGLISNKPKFELISEKEGIFSCPMDP